MTTKRAVTRDPLHGKAGPFPGFVRALRVARLAAFALAGLFPLLGLVESASAQDARLREGDQLEIRIDKGYYYKKWSLMFYLDIQNVLGYKAQQPDILVNTQEDGSVVKYIDDKGQERYKLRTIPNKAGTVLPAIGVMAEF